MFVIKAKEFSLLKNLLIKIINNKKPVQRVIDKKTALAERINNMKKDDIKRIYINDFAIIFFKL